MRTYLMRLVDAARILTWAGRCTRGIVRAIVSFVLYSLPVLVACIVVQVDVMMSVNVLQAVFLLQYPVAGSLAMLLAW